jgi:hypothetical protein
MSPTVTVYTATDGPVDLNRQPDPTAMPGTSRAMGGVFVTEDDITTPLGFAIHCRMNVPASGSRPPGAWPRFITEIEADRQTLQPDPHGRPPCGWIPPGIGTSRIVRRWEVIESPDGAIQIVPLP